ncbi:hypothetical protein BDW22DRAFT_1484956 [Trametopsis cervina]|nr:hypothetical protein BDW22DRAFT_1484956 [Trametopsis cervina]
MSKVSQNADKGTRKLTDFFSVRSSVASSPLSQPPSSQPQSSQAGPSQQTPGPSILHSQKKSAKKSREPPPPDREVISLSSDSGPIVISSDTAQSHVSIPGKTSSAIIISDSSSQKKPLSIKASSRPVKKGAPMKRLPQPAAHALSSAKTTVKKRTPAVVVPGLPPRLTLPKATRPKKRKCSWDTSSSSSEQSEGRIYVPKPGLMKPSLTHPPVPRGTAAHSKAAPVSPSTALPIPSSPLSSIYSTRSRLSKRTRLDTTGPSTAVSGHGDDDDEEELVPSSQSDEQELTIPKDVKKDPVAVKQTVDKWRRESSLLISPVRIERSSSGGEPPASPPATSPTESSPLFAVSSPLTATTDLEGDVEMFDLTSVQDPPKISSQTGSHNRDSARLNASPRPQPEPSPIHASTSTATVHTSLMTRSPLFRNGKTSNGFPSLSPPAAGGYPKSRRSTPIALNAEQKTAMVIQRLKQEAAARAAEAGGSSEDEHVSFSDINSESSEEELFYGKKGKNKARIMSASAVEPSIHTPSPQPTLGGPRRASTRISLRRQSSPTALHTRAMPLEPVAVTRTVRKSGANPLDKLLREKKTAERQGAGPDGLRAAEVVLANAGEGKGKMKAEMDDEESDEDDAKWADEAAAMHIVDRASKGLASNGPGLGSDSGDSDNEGQDFSLHAATRLLGADDRKTDAVNRILSKDRTRYLTKKKVKKPARGIHLWIDEVIPVSEHRQSLPALPFTEAQLESDKPLKLLWSVLRSNDERRLSQCLVPQLVSSVLPAHTMLLVSWLTSVALSSSTEALAQRASCLIASVSSRYARTPFSVSPLVVACLRALGAKEECLAVLSLPAVHVQSCSPTLARSVMSVRLIGIIKTFVGNDMVPLEDIPSLMVALLLMGLEPSASSELRNDVTRAIDTLAARLPSSSEGVSNMEYELCAKLREISTGWTSMNRAFMISLLRGGSSQVTRMARWLSYMWLLGTPLPARTQYLGLPRLEPVIELMRSSAGSGAVFDVMGNAHKEDFCEELSCHVDILDEVLYDIEAFVQEEKRITATAKLPEGSRPGSPEKPEPELEQIIHLLEKIHGKINDSRAGDLERSRVKASMQHIWSRVRYQRIACLRAGSAGKPRNIRGYFPRPIPALHTNANPPAR